MDTVKVRAKDNHRNVLEVDQSNADLLIARGTWELVPAEKEEVTKDDGSKPAGRRRAPRSSGAS